ncbi:MAG TPA: YdcF family protein [Planctomycetaceae bacterium]|nr:YdcF family protein [Planctomycetaceae bacterium]
MYALTQEILKPFPLFMWLTGILLITLWRRYPEQRRRMRALLFVYALLLLDSLPLTAILTNHWLETMFPKVTARPAGVQAIVVLGGGVLQPRSADEPTRPDASTLYRTLRALELYQAGPPCLIILAGGEPDPLAPGEPAAVVMAALLKQSGVNEADLIIEDQSRNTAENAKHAVRILQERHVSDGILVVSTATHLWRAERLFRNLGTTVTPVGCDYHAEDFPLRWTLFWPSGHAVMMNQWAWHEYLGSIWLRIRGEW